MSFFRIPIAAIILQVIEIVNFGAKLAIVEEPFLGIVKFVEQRADVTVSAFPAGTLRQLANEFCNGCILFTHSQQDHHRCRG